MIVYDIEQCSEDWYALRAGIPTASEAGKLITGTGKESKQIVEYAYQLAAEKYAGMPLDRWEGNTYTDRGKELEQEALIAYEQEKGVWVDRVGFCMTDDNLCGCSPDGILDDGLAEVKCLAAKNHVKNMIYFKKHKKLAPDYVPQVQFQLLVTQKLWCDSVFYHPDLPMLIIRNERDEDYQKLLLEKIYECVKLRDDAYNILSEGDI